MRIVPLSLGWSAHTAGSRYERCRMSYQLLFDEARRLLLVRFAGPLGRADFEALTTDMRAFAQRHGGCDGIVDFSAVTNIGPPLDFMRTCSQHSRAMSGFPPVLLPPR